MTDVFFQTLFFLNISFRSQRLRAQHRSACRAADGIVGKPDKFIIKYAVLPQTSDGHAHPVLVVHVQLYLGTVVLLLVADELLRSAGKLCLLGEAFEIHQLFDSQSLQRLPQYGRSAPAHGYTGR